MGSLPKGALFLLELGRNAVYATQTMEQKPEILAPAGDISAALAAFAAGADAVYLGLKHFSARMQAENFSSRDLSRLVDLAHEEQRRVYIAFNTLFKPYDLAAAGRLLERVNRGIGPDALIVQDLAALELARQAGYEGKIFLSTLANVTHQAALVSARNLGASRVILPRELSIDEIRLMDAARPPELDFEFFIHGALCYCVSGRCWWSSYMGGKSGLRGRCVQPCRRVYTQRGKEGRFFSCLDLSLDVLVKTLLSIPGVASWKIEGRKKGPHYVYYVTTAYRLLRDEGADPAARKEAMAILDMALGRPVTRARFLARKDDPGPVALDGQTSSGLLAGKVSRTAEGAFILKPRFPLLAKDLLRIGVEDESWHATLPVNRAVPKGGTLTLKLPRQKSPKSGTPVFLIDRREPELMQLLRHWEDRLAATAGRPEAALGAESGFSPRLPAAARPVRPLHIALRSSLPRGREGKNGIKPGSVQGLWLSPKALTGVSRTLFARISWWLPPVMWPDEEEQWQILIQAARQNGARHFVCNEPWQNALFRPEAKAVLSAGPFCNTSNALALQALQSMGFATAFISPELSGEELLALPSQSPIPLGIVVSGYWPMGITRHSIAPLSPDEGFQSPKGEVFWARRYGQNYWIYPNWPLDLVGRLPQLEQAGYSTFVHMQEYPPQKVPEPRRASEFNWENGLM